MKRARRILLLLGVVGLVAVIALITAAYLAPLPDRMHRPDSAVVEFRDGTPAHVFLSPDEKWRISRPLAEIDPHYVAALLHLEDGRFRSHMGVDPLAVLRAAVVNVRRGRVVSGASTITMQLARLLEPRPRTFRSKAIEAFRAIQLELHMSKDEILEAYLSLVPFGRNVEGVEAAALSYFGHSATALSPAEIATLLAVPQNPNRRYPHPENAARLVQARNEIGRRLLEGGAMPEALDEDLATSSAQILEQIQATATPQVLRPFPRHAPHFAYWLRARHPQNLRIRTTLDAGSQALAEQALGHYRQEAERMRIHNGAVVVLDHTTGEARALVGNFEFSDTHGGQIPGFSTPRSPGSLLKPFIYAAAIDRGLALPGFLVEDTPFEAGMYTPENYSGTFQGLVYLEEALSKSLNIPFIRLLVDLGVEVFVGQLRSLGFEHLSEEPGHYGLSLAVGSAGMTPMEIAGAFGTLARGGIHVPVRVVPQQGEVASHRIYSPGASWLTSRALAISDRPGFPGRRKGDKVIGHVHWKTGTSYGHRDAWAAGYLGPHTAVVWMGNFNNVGSSGLVGAERAGPALFDILEGLVDRRSTTLQATPAPDDLIDVEVCSYSGHLTSTACVETTQVLGPRRSVPTATCPYHVRHDIDDETGLAMTPSCRAGRAYTSRSFVIWPARVRRWLSEQNRSVDPIPAYAPWCDIPSSRQPPRINSPPENQSLLLVPGVSPEHQQVPLEVDSAAANARMSWFVNGEFLGTTDPDERLWWVPRVGRFEFVVMDEVGRSSRRVLEVRGAGVVR